MPNEELVPDNAPIYPIRTAVKLTGVNARRIRAWEDKYNILKPWRTEGGHRLYSDKDVKLIMWIKAMLVNGASLQGIAEMRKRNGGQPVE